MGLPSRLTPRQCRVIAAAGLAPENLRSLEFRPGGICAEVFVRDRSGRPRINWWRSEFVTRRIFIPVKD